jgi:signal transduction histidine kinase
MHVKLEAFNLIFSQEYLRAALMVSLLSVWVLVGLFFYLNRFTRRQYFTVWTAAWLFYALWLTLCLTAPDAAVGSLMFLFKQWCIAVSAVFLLWGSLAFLSLPVRQTSFGLFMLFLMVWSVVSPAVLSSAVKVEMPVFLLLGSGSVFAASCFFRLRKKMPYVGAGMLSLGFTLWGVYLATYPMSLMDNNLRSAGFFAAAVVQLYIAVSMIVLVLEEVRHKTEQMRAEMEAVRLEKEQLQVKVVSAEEQCRSLYDQVRLTQGVQKAYDELRRTQANVVRQERLCALGQMASGVAHDVNNSLSPIAAYSDLLLMTVPELPESARRYLQTIHRCGDDIAHIVSRMREFYRPQAESESLVMVNVNEIIEETIELTRPRWRDLPQRQGVSIQIQPQLADKLPRLLCDPRDLCQALTNLIFNAVDALPQGGKITLVTSTFTWPDPSDERAKVAHLQIQVRDNGLGMDEHTRQHCLEPFFSTKAQRGGTGLGLAMVYGMMRRHDGSIDIESTPGSGTCVRLTFPVREKALSSPKAEPAPPKPSRCLNVLCVDDEPELRTLLHDCLGVFHHRVTVASNGVEGLKLFQDALIRKQPFEAVITDLGMPEMDGKQLTHSIKAQAPQTPVIMMTGWGAIMKADGESAGEVDALLSKPVRLQELNTLLLELCR